MDDSTMARAGVVMFLEKHREVTDALVGLLNKQQKLSSLAIQACTGQEYEVRAIVADKVIQGVAQRGPQLLIDILGIIETQMDDALAALNAAFEAAAQQQAFVEAGEADDEAAEADAQKDAQAEAAADVIATAEED